MNKKICKVCGDNFRMRKLWCNKHYLQIQRHGKILKRTIYDSNEIINYEKHSEICLYNRQSKEIARAKIDKDDLEKVKKYKWCLNTMGYVAADIKINKKRTIILLHHLILPRKKGLQNDHENRDRLDNRKKNLRYATCQQNQMNQKIHKHNTSGYKGLSWNKALKKWETYIEFNGKKINLGYFKDKKDAIKTRELAEIKHFGKFRRK